jgi:hypothetical protein
MRLLTLLLASLLAGCASSKVDQQLDPKTANARAIEQQRMQAITSGAWAPASERGEEVLAPKPKEFNMGALRTGFNKSFDGKAAPTSEFHFVDKTRTKPFGTRDYVTKGAWMGDMKFGTKEAKTKESWFSKRTAETKTYGTKVAHDASKSAATRALPGGDKPFLVQGRRQADLDSNGRQKIPFGTSDLGQSWSGDLKPLTIEDVKGLLNKN